MPRKSRYDNPEILNQILQMYQVGQSQSVIAAQTGCNRHWLGRLLRNRGLLRTKSETMKLVRRPHIDLDELRRLYLVDGWSQEKVSAKYGIWPKTLSRILLENGIVKSRHELLLRLEAASKDWSTSPPIPKEDVLYKHGVTIDQLRQYRYKLGIKCPKPARGVHYPRWRHGRNSGQTSTETEKQIITLYQSGLNCCNIADRLGMHPSSIPFILRRNGVVLRPNTGKNCPLYKHGLTTAIAAARDSFYAKRWRSRCFSRDRRCSVISGQRGNMECHHKWPFSQIWRQVVTKYKPLGDCDERKVACLRDRRLHDTDNGITLLKEEHQLIISAYQHGHPYWQIGKIDPAFAQRHFQLPTDWLDIFNGDGQVYTTTATVRQVAATQDIRTILRYEHYLGTLPVSQLILVSYVNWCIVGVASFGRGSNKNLPYDCLELTRLCVPYYVVRPFSVDFLAMCIMHIRMYHPDIRSLVAYADPAFGHDGGVYRMARWLKGGHTPPSYMYYDPATSELYHKARCRRLPNIDKTEKQLAQERGWIKIPTPGKLRYRYYFRPPDPTNAISV